MAGSPASAGPGGSDTLGAVVPAHRPSTAPPAAEGAAARRAAAKAEEDRIQGEMARWKTKLDGVLGRITDSAPQLSPNLKSNSARPIPPPPKLGMPQFSPLESAFISKRSSPSSSPEKSKPRRSSSASPERRKAPGSNLSPKQRSDWEAYPSANGKAVVSSPGSKTSALSPTPPTVAARSASLPTASLSPPAESATPSIRLVSPKASLADLGAKSSAKDSTTSLPDDDVQPVYAALGALGLGMATTAEGAPSREAANGAGSSAASKSTISLPPSNQSTPVPASSPSVLVTQPKFETSSVSSSPAGSPILARRQFTRQSALPGIKHSSPSQVSSSTSLPISVGEETGTLTPTAELPASATLEERAQHFAQRCWDEDPSFLRPAKIAEWLGKGSEVNAAALKLYMHRFDFSALKLDQAFRRLCQKLNLRAEAQQLDRILEQFAVRYHSQNGNNIFGSSDTIHAVSYSLLMLNTDLHAVSHANKMTQTQFIENTMGVVRPNYKQPEDQLASASAAELSAITNPSTLFAPGTPLSEEPSLATSAGGTVFGGENSSTSHVSTPATPNRRPMERRLTNASISSVREAVSAAMASAASLGSLSAKGDGEGGLGTPRRSGTRSRSGSTVNNAQRKWESDVESALKDIYQSIKRERILQPESAQRDSPEQSRPSLSLAPSSPYSTWGPLGRNASNRRSMLPTTSGGLSTGPASAATLSRVSMRPSSAFLGPGSSGMEFTRSSSPTPSTATSFSDDYKPNNGIGFASNLSHAIIKEQQEDDGLSTAQADDNDAASLSDDDLALLGAPWAKEGILQRKHYWESVGKRSKNKAWVEAFVVVSAGHLRLFKFGSGTGGGGLVGGGVGGGDWTNNASLIDQLDLTHALCSEMPPPGYSRQRPHCFVLTLPGGGSYFFQAGTQDLVAEWVATCNYWAARLSREPLPSGISNMEYGWNRCLAQASPPPLPNSPDAGGSKTAEQDEDPSDSVSVKSGKSTRSTRSRFSTYSTASRSWLHDKVTIVEWSPPSARHGESTLPEEGQLEALRRALALLRAELSAHTALQQPMKQLYLSRSPQGLKAQGNWKRKSAYLTTEIVKYQTYVDALVSAIKLRALRRGQKEVEDMLAAADEVDVDVDADGATNGAEDDDAVEDERSRAEKRAAALEALERGNSAGPASVTSTEAAADQAQEFFDASVATPTEASFARASEDGAKNVAKSPSASRLEKAST